VAFGTQRRSGDEKHVLRLDERLQVLGQCLVDFSHCPSFGLFLRIVH